MICCQARIEKIKTSIQLRFHWEAIEQTCGRVGPAENSSTKIEKIRVATTVKRRSVIDPILARTYQSPEPSRRPVYCVYLT